MIDLYIVPKVKYINDYTTRWRGMENGKSTWRKRDKKGNVVIKVDKLDPQYSDSYRIMNFTINLGKIY